MYGYMSSLPACGKCMCAEFPATSLPPSVLAGSRTALLSLMVSLLLLLLLLLLLPNNECD